MKWLGLLVDDEMSDLIDRIIDGMIEYVLRPGGDPALKIRIMEILLEEK